MTAGHLPKCPSFADWYYAINGRWPFPWQSRLANQVVGERGWPRLVGVPTGLGKTACIDIAVWALAHQADRSPAERVVPTRIWWVVNRRLLVDDTFRHAEQMAERLIHADDGLLADVATRLRQVSGSPSSTASPLEVIQMRGGVGRPADQPSTMWRTRRPSTPAQPAVICSTIPMFGSRVLFRGYGTSRSMRPIDAALAYVDSLVLIDEAHLAGHLQGLLEDLARLDTGEIAMLPEERRRPVVVALTATGDTDTEPFELDEHDHSNETIRQRLNADKPLRIELLKRATTPSTIARGLASTLEKLISEEPPGVSLVFVNSPVTARLVAKCLRRRSDLDVVVATGQIRGHEAEQVTANILEETRSGVNESSRERHFVVVSTQTLEVGADIDADYLVTEGCGVRALTQRLGRLNRLGLRPHAKGVYVHTAAKKGIWPVYGEEPAAVFDRLKAHADAGVVQLPPADIAAVLGDPRDRPDPAPVVAPGLLWEWTKTTTPPPGEAPVNPYFAGYDELQRHVNVAWRAHLEPHQKLWPRLDPTELVEVVLSEAKGALEDLDGSWFVLDHRELTVELASSDDLKPGDTILILSDTGLLDRDGHWDPEATQPVLDVSISRSGLPVAPGVVTRLYAGSLSEPSKDVVASVTKTCRDVEKVIAAILAAYYRDENEVINEQCRHLSRTLQALSASVDNLPRWNSFASAIEDGLASRISEKGLALIVPQNEVPRLPILRHASAELTTERSDEDEELSLDTHQGDPSSLKGHSDYTHEKASQIAKAIGIIRPLTDIVCRAARLHDIGKADPRFQRWLDPEWTIDNGLFLAKSRVPRSAWARHRATAGWPLGGRHEELSRRLIEEWLANGEHDMNEHDGRLLQQLVVSHHGQGRPLVVPVQDTSGGSYLDYEIQQGTTVMVSSDLSYTDWEQPARFAYLNQRFGPWGLALLETIVRQADHVASSVSEVG